MGAENPYVLAGLAPVIQVARERPLVRDLDPRGQTTYAEPESKAGRGETLDDGSRPVAAIPRQVQDAAHQAGGAVHIGSIILALVLVMLVGAFWAPNRDPNPVLRRSQFVTSTFGLVGLANLTGDTALPIGFDLHHLAPYAWLLFVLSAIIVPAFRQPAGRAANI